MSHPSKKRPVILTLLFVAVAIIGVGIALDGTVTPPASDTNTLIDNLATQSAPSQGKPASTEPAQPSEVAQQLRQAIEAANRSEANKAERLQQQAASGQAKIKEINRIIMEKGGSGQRTSSNERVEQFNQRVEELKARMAELQETK